MRFECLYKSFFIFFFLFSLVAMPAALAAEENCHAAIPLSLDDTVRMGVLAAGQSDLFVLEISAPGIVALAIALPGSAAAEPLLTFLGTSCSAAPKSLASEKDAVLERGARSQLIEARAAGTYYLRVAALDGSRAFESYRLSAGWVEWPGAGESLATKDDPEECLNEILRLNCTSPLAGPVSQWCDSLTGDDHGDSLLCASPISPGRRVRGELESSWGDDYDVFTFTLDEPTVVRIRSTGAVDTFGVLYDGFGQRLAAAGEGGVRGNFRFVKLLAAGRYFVRLEGVSGDEGSYGLVIRQGRGN